MTDTSFGRKKKRVTYIASLEGVEKAENALRRLGFESKANFAQSQLLARTTVTKFFQRQPIQLNSFQKICDALKLNWKEIALIIEEEQPQRLGIRDCIIPDTNEGVEPVQTLRRKVTVTDEQSQIIKAVITLEGDINSIQNYKILQFILREYSGDSIKIVDHKEGSIKLIIEGSQEDIQRLVSQIESGELTEVNGFPIEDVQILSESSDLDESTKLNDKWDLVREIVSQPVEGRNLRGADLSDADLSGADLSNADLSGADLSGADLSNVNLSYANLNNADLSGAILSNANLINANLINANLINANLSDANLSDANLSDANLSDANLSDANLSDANLNNANLSDAILSSANLTSTVLSSTNFRNASDELDLNLKLFFESFVKAVESKDERELNTLISDNYRSDTLMNRNKRELISFITNLPEIPLLKFQLNVSFLNVKFDKERDTYDVIIKPNYTYKFLWLNLVTGIFGRAEIVSVFLEKHPTTELYWIVRMDELDRNQKKVLGKLKRRYLGFRV